MKNKRHLFFLLLGLLSFNFIQLDAQEIVENVTFKAEQADFRMISPSSYLLEIAGPNGYYFKDNLDNTNNLSISNIKTDGTKFNDGQYQMQITPIIQLTETQRKEMNELRTEGNIEKIENYRIANELPESVATYSIYFSIRNGEFVRPDQKEFRAVKMPSSAYTWENDHPALYASLNEVVMEFGEPVIGQPNHLTSDKTMSSADDQVFLDDVIVDGSICVGMDCVNGENFGFDTQRIKENNLRIHFNDTSSSASFPSNDWRISINDSSNGGSNYFAVEDATAGTTPFRVEAGAGNNALHVDASGGNVGMGTATPIVELHVADGDSPTMRLEQNGSSGFGSQTWDIAGNETNFFVRDVTNGSKLPFRIKPSAPTNSIFIKADGDIGLGTENPTEALQVESGNVYMKAGNLGINKVPTVALDVLGTSKFEGDAIYTGDVTYNLGTGATFISSTSFATTLRVDAANNKVGIGTSFPATELEVCGTISASSTTIANSTTCFSDIRFKKNIQPLESTLEKLLSLRGVNYDWKIQEFADKGFSERNQIGFIAQELELLFPELVETGATGYKAVDYAKMSPVLVEAIKEQQNIIDSQQDEIASLQKQVDELQGLKAQVAALTGMVTSLKKADEIEEVESVGKKK